MVEGESKGEVVRIRMTEGLIDYNKQGGFQIWEKNERFM